MPPEKELPGIAWSQQLSRIPQLQAGSMDKLGRVKVHQRIPFFFSPDSVAFALRKISTWRSSCNTNENGVESDNGTIPESFYTNGGFKLHVVWTISSLIATAARHYLLQPIIAERKTWRAWF